MSKTFNSVAFDIFSQEKDVVTLRDFVNGKDSLSFKRAAPKRQKDFPGMEKTEMKVTITDPVLGPVGIMTISTSIRADQNDTLRSHLVGVGVAAVQDTVYEQLVHDQRLPIGV